jgi:predicted transcriptional regulator
LTERHTLVDVIEALADSKSLDIFCSIAKGNADCNVLKGTKGLTRKQYYFRTKRLMEVGLVKRIKGRFSLTNFGVIINHAELLMEAGLNNYWKLKAVDSIQSSGTIAEHERSKLIRTIINDNAIENILVKQK